MEFNWSSFTESEMQKYRDLCPDNEYRILKLDFKLPGIATSLTQKCPMVMIAASGDASGRAYYMANLFRLDTKDSKGKAVDQMPFGFVFDSTNPLLSGALIQHGDWIGRTTYPAPSSWESVVEGTYSTFASLSLVPPASAGSIFDLNLPTQLYAFSTLMNGLSEKVQSSMNDSET